MDEPKRQPMKKYGLPDLQFTPSMPDARSMSRVTSWKTMCQILLNELNADIHHLYSWPFFKVSDMINYQKFKVPMDLNTISKKLGQDQYTQPNEFVEDVRTIFSNCYRHNTDNEFLAMVARFRDTFEVAYAKTPLPDLVAPPK